jgi:DNA-binding NarL/FixJ family response regulator
MTYKASSYWHRLRDQKIISLYEDGKNIYQIADEMGLSAQHIQVILKHYEELK